MFSIKSKIFTCLTPFASIAWWTVTSKIPIQILARSTVKTRDWITVIAIWENQPSDTWSASNRIYMYEVFEYTVCKRGLPVARVKNQTPVKPGNQRNKIYKIYLECHKTMFDTCTFISWIIIKSVIMFSCIIQVIK